MKDHTQKEFEKRLNRAWKTISEGIIASEQQPKAYVLGGQPAAGKSGLSKKIEERFKNNAITINGDDYRKYHKNYNEFQEKYGQDASKYTGEFAGKMTEALIKKASDEKFNLIIEGTFRTVEAPLKTLQGLKDKGYSVNVAIQTCPKELSLLSTKIRYFTEEHLNKGKGRMTPESHHNLVVDVLGQNAEAIYKTGIAEHFFVQSRSEVLYDSAITKEPFKAEIINKELNRSAAIEIKETQKAIEKVLPLDVIKKIFSDNTQEEKKDMKKEFSERLVKVRGAKANKESQELKQTNDIKQKL